MPSVPSAGRIYGTHAFSQASPVAIEHECMSWHSFGVIHANCGRPRLRSFVSRPNGTTLAHRFSLVRTSSKYMNGSCFFAYSFGEVPANAPVKQARGIDSM